MEKKTPTIGDKIITGFAKALPGILKSIFYVVAFFGFTYGFYAYTAHKESQKTFVRYNADNMPAHFPALITRMQDNETPIVQLEYLYISQDVDVQMKLHQDLGEGEVKIDAYDSGYYLVEPISGTRKQITLDIWVGGGDGREKYVYEVEGNRVYPQSFQLMSYFGWSFSAGGSGLLATVIFIIVCEKFFYMITKTMAVRKLKLTP